MTEWLRRIQKAFVNMNQRIEDIENKPLTVNPADSEMPREQAIDMLMAELQKGIDSVKSESGWMTQEAVCQLFGVTLND